jgi:hypothetical protein
MSAHSPGRQTAAASGKAMLTDAEFGLLLRLVAAEINDQETTNCERYLSDAAAAAFARQMSRLRTVQRKLRRHRQALRQPDGGTRPVGPAGRARTASRGRS